MLDAPTLEVVKEGVLVVTGLCLVLLMMSHWDQRHNRPTSLDVRFFLLHVRYKSGIAPTSTDTATRDDDETAGARTLPFPSAAPPTQQESPRYRAA